MSTLPLGMFAARENVIRHDRCVILCRLPVDQDNKEPQ